MIAENFNLEKVRISRAIDKYGTQSHKIERLKVAPIFGKNLH